MDRHGIAFIISAKPIHASTKIAFRYHHQGHPLQPARAGGDRKWAPRRPAPTRGLSSSHSRSYVQSVRETSSRSIGSAWETPVGVAWPSSIALEQGTPAAPCVGPIDAPRSIPVYPLLCPVEPDVRQIHLIDVLEVVSDSVVLQLLQKRVHEDRACKRLQEVEGEPSVHGRDLDAQSLGGR